VVLSHILLLLEKTMLLKLIYPVINTRLPLEVRNRSPRLQLLDIGLVNYMARVQQDVFDSEKIEDAWRGRVAEQVTAQEILAGKEFTLINLPFYLAGRLDQVLGHVTGKATD
jgi:hypothetical protein